ncbi:MAG: HD domain-containing protein, partial [Candidatus Bathyarchaeota archaeon]|nr:HD domain-containing protein [Candidatus Bathyarchaeota archaeon]
MKTNWLMKKVKYGEPTTSETFIEHAIKTFHVGKYIYDQLKLRLNEEEFLYGCFFHDVGKLLAGPGEPHTPKTKEALELIKNTREYQTILRAFGFDDLSRHEHVIHAIEKHHDSADELSAYIAIADQIASSESDEDLKNRLKKSPISTLITYLNEMQGFSNLHFYYIR